MDRFPILQILPIKLIGNKFHLTRHGKNSLHLNRVKAAGKTPAISTLLQEPSQQKKVNAIKEAELRLCCYIAEQNLPMLLMDTLPLLNKELYPDSNIAKNINMKRLKATKLITGILGPAFKTEIINDLKNVKFSLITDETTDLSVKKSLVIVTRYWRQGQTQDRFLDLVEVEEVTSEDLFNIIKNILVENGIPFDNVIGFASDNASTMMGVVKGVQARFKEILSHIYVQGCTCHSLHLCSSAAAKKLPNNVEQFTRDIYAYFAHSSKRISELKECQIFANEKPHKMLHPSQTRWLSLKNVVDRILEHWNSLILFFQRAALEDNLPSARSILNALQNIEYKLYLLFLDYVLELINKVNMELQLESPKLPILLNRILALHRTLKQKTFFTKTSGSNLDLTLEKFWEVEKVPEVVCISPEEEYCHKYFEETTTLSPQGRYVVSLPFGVVSPDFGDTRTMALKRFYALERRLL
ncbi:LOW QUALITY PROTEIN: uncharacterized protein LOC126738788 [Anthonomus grandis grandis]|uniref:LOW QUALITY PROTEIN: uncharacterized protein LOC126738788 n=1 Tax=Anthonomus grandis grandis TaxID=2921223 RepID=UPI0021665C32|nr:LOW QUALITY PROTEIN: uncharacterized protein LOC126738788 [Anthonomus grandis grandis]